ncbi:hypothetical protein Taro_001016, partial [Colocasia esculenta]|nr:hypothetical protein [Colocasia esculenta]
SNRSLNGCLFCRLWRLVDVEELFRPGVMSQQEVRRLQHSRLRTRLEYLCHPHRHLWSTEHLCKYWCLRCRLSAQTTATLQEQVQVQAQAPAHEAVFGGVPMMERFRRMTPPFFKGESDLILAESWLRETEKIFHTLRCVEEERVTLAMYML